MAFPYAGDATLRAKMAGKLKLIAVATHRLAPACHTPIAGVGERRLRFEARRDFGR
jgi:hypothetical protein